MVSKQKKHVVVLDENSMNASTKRLKHEEQSSLVDSADVPRRGYFLENRKPLVESEIPQLEIGSADFDPCWEQLANASRESTNILSRPPKVAPNTSLGQRKHESTDVIDDSGDETDDEDWKTLDPAGLRWQSRLKSDAEVVAVKTAKGRSPKPEAKKGQKGPVKKTRTGSHKRKDQSDPTLAPWAVRPENIPDDGQLRNKFGRTKQEVIELRRASQKKDRAKRTPSQKEHDNNYAKQWREDNKEYVAAFDHLRRAEKVDSYTPVQAEEARVKAREKEHARVANDLEANPVKGVRIPETGEQLRKKCAVLTTLPPEVQTDTLDCGLHLVICARKSWRAQNGEHLELEYGNQVILQKFITDFVNPIPVLTITSIVWHGRAADDALPWVVRGEDDDDLPLALLDGAGLWNENADRRFSNVFAGKPDYATILAVVRGIDGASVNIDSWIGLQTRYPKLNIVLAFTCAELYVRFRAPADHSFFYRTDPYDERLYSFFSLSSLINYVTGTAPLAKYAWLLSEWRVATVWRQAISVAYQSGDQESISQVMAAFGLQRFRPRNGLPLARDA